jgi:hypothetical protein
MCLIGWPLDIIFRLQIVYQPIIKGMSGFVRASKFAELVAWQGTPVFVIESVGRLAIDIL